jgi:hypothetical protein
MGPNAESPSSRLPYLETIHADLVQKVWALERLRKQVEQKEAALREKIASQKQQSARPFHTEHHAGDGPRKPCRLHDHPNLLAGRRQIGAR